MRERKGRKIVLAILFLLIAGGVLTHIRISGVDAKSQLANEVYSARELIAEIVEIARFAPSWKNTQIARYIVVDNPEKIAALASDKCTYGFEYNIKTIAKAPAVVLLTIVEGRSGFEKDGSFSTPKEDRW